MVYIDYPVLLLVCFQCRVIYIALYIEAFHEFPDRHFVMSQYVNLVFVLVLQILDAFFTPFVFRVQRPEYDDCHPGYHVACLRHKF